MKNTKKILFYIILVIILVAMGWYLWNLYNGDVEVSNLDYVPFADFEIASGNNGKVISHKSSGFSMTVPGDWEEGYDYYGISFVSLDYVVDVNAKAFASPFPETGCIVSLSIIQSDTPDYADYYNTNLDIKACSQDNAEYCEGYIIGKLSGHDTVERLDVMDNDKISGKYLEIKTPFNNNTYTLETYLSGEDADRCENDLRKILESVKIR